MTGMFTICHTVALHRMPTLRPLHTHHDGSSLSLYFSCISWHHPPFTQHCIHFPYTNRTFLASLAFILASHHIPASELTPLTVIGVSVDLCHTLGCGIPVASWGDGSPYLSSPFLLTGLLACPLPWYQGHLGPSGIGLFLLFCRWSFGLVGSLPLLRDFVQVDKVLLACFLMPGGRGQVCCRMTLSKWTESCLLPRAGWMRTSLLPC